MWPTRKAKSSKSATSGADQAAKLVKDAGNAINFSSTHALIAMIRKAWRLIRVISGDDAYERYLAHWQRHHQNASGNDTTPLDRKSFHAAEIQRRWSGIKRCC
jgi:uncharacterized short protein YbdD (DUF466 family)